MYTNVGISKATGGGASVAGGAMVLTGIFFVPVTFGASLGITVGGFVIGAAGGIITLGASLAQLFINNKKTESAKKLHHEVIQLVSSFSNSLTQYTDALDQCQNFVDKEKDIKFKKELEKNLKSLKGPLLTIQSVNGVQKIVFDSTTLGISNDKTKLRLEPIVGSTAVAIKAIGAASTQLADEIAAPGIKIGSSVLVRAGGTGAKVLSGAVGVIGIGFGIWDIRDGALDIKN